MQDVRRVREHPLVPGEIPIFGFIYDVRTGRLNEVKAASKAGQRAERDSAQIANEVPQPQDELAFGFLTLK